MAKILIYSPNVIGKSMAGAAIRPWEFAKILSQKHQVVLLSPGKSDVQSPYFEVVSFLDPQGKKHFKDADILIAQRLTFPLACLAKLYRLNIIIDAYVPGPLELMEHFKGDIIHDRKKKVFSETSNIILSFKMADGILCASEKQRDLWLGFLLSLKLITPEMYDRRAGLREFLTVIPFGLPSQPPKKSGEGLREKFNFSPNDKVILWGGGLWNWFDPLSLIQAMNLIQKKRKDIKLVFMGVQPPDPSLPTTTMSARAMTLAEELELINQTVFFNYDWIPYEERENFLLDADIGVSTHFEHLETEFSFRTRILDYLWAALPMVVTKGDAFAELIEKNRLGIVIPYQNAEAIAEGLMKLVNDPKEFQEIKHRVHQMKEKFYWTSVTVPLVEMVDRLLANPPQRKRWKEGKELFQFLMNKIQERGVVSCINQYLFRRKIYQ